MYRSTLHYLAILALHASIEDSHQMASAQLLFPTAAEFAKFEELERHNFNLPKEESKNQIMSAAPTQMQQACWLRTYSRVEDGGIGLAPNQCHASEERDEKQGVCY